VKEPPLSDLSRRIAETILEQQLFRPGETLIIGLSGGADSTALLDLLANLPEGQPRLVAAHLNHCLRGAESDADEEFCRGLAEQYKIPFESRRVHVKTFAGSNALNLEDAGRQARIAFFDKLTITWKATAVVLAHHADDQAETVLMRLLRGSGMTGLAGMSYKNGRGIIRPLLNITRAEIETYLAERSLVWREDESNQDKSFLRNRLRHELLPILEQINPAVRSCLLTTATVLSAENELLDRQTVHAAEQICHVSANGITCSINQLIEYPLPLQRRIIRLMMLRQRGDLNQFSYQHVDAICRMIASTRPNSKISLPHGIVAVKEYDSLAFRTGEYIQHQKIEFRIPGPGVYRLPDNALLTLELSPVPSHVGTMGAGTAYFDLAKAPFPWDVRTFLPGDRIQPLGMTGRKKMKEVFIENKVPPSLRSRTPLIFCGDDLIWACGLRASHHSRLDGKSSQTVKIVYSRQE
jgi:tRNA(Ile)-lysidine synthase